MEHVTVAIVGAGPAGLVLGLSLEQNGVSSIILERENEVTEDPRGVYLAGDAVRILYSLGLGRDMPIIGHELKYVQFHTSSFANPPFRTLDLSRDNLQQGVPMGILQIQPNLEKSLRKHLEKSKLCELRKGCDVTGIKQVGEGTELEYTGPDGSRKHLQCSWLVGADGKKGVVRKYFLEPEADIRQVFSDYRYEGTWVAANLKISLPTPETHSDLAVWKAGMKPHEVYDLFWPKGWHFCAPPGKPTASGRFGPYDERLWRHEFRQDGMTEKDTNSEELLWEHLTPMITRTKTEDGRPFGEAVTFPRDCIKILRCRPFTFTHKIVNRWFHRQTILIGDAAHVFPPFGGQGIASGIRDAHQLAGRISILERLPQKSPAKTKKIMDAWASERTQSVKSAAYFTRINGMLCNQGVTIAYYVLKLVEFVMTWVFWSANEFDPQADAEKAGFKDVPGGFFLKEHGGGIKLPQIYVDSVAHGRAVLSDGIFDKSKTPLHILALVESNEALGVSSKAIKSILLESKVPDSILSPESFAVMSRTPCQPEAIGSFAAPTTRKFTPTPKRRLGSAKARRGYDETVFRERLGPDTKYVIVRPDFYVFAIAKDLEGLRQCLRGLADSIESE